MSEVSQHPAQAVQQLATAYWASRCLHIAAELGVADVLGDEPQTAEAIAQSLGVQQVMAKPLVRVDLLSAVRDMIGIPPRCMRALNVLTR